MALSDGVEVYGRWRNALADTIRRCAAWVGEAGLGDAAFDARVDGLVELLREDHLTVAFVAEFSRGKSELINAIFFADLGQRVLPSAAGRTTMCPTELAWDASLPPSIRLLPIETRLEEGSLATLRTQAAKWSTFEFDPRNAGEVAAAFSRVSQTRAVPVEEARALGLYDEENSTTLPGFGDTAVVEVPRWRHALVNLPHPLLRQGLTIIDTPGLNAIGAEPELTFNLIPSANAVVFVLAADAGVTRSDIDVWRAHVGDTQSRFVVLNKIDGLWDPLRGQAEIDAEIARQVHSVASTLRVDAARVFPVSAQKGLAAKVNGDRDLLSRSRIAALEKALADQLVPDRFRVVGERVRAEFGQAAGGISALLAARGQGLSDQLHDLAGLRGRSGTYARHMSERIRGERDEFENTLRRLQALRSVFGRHADEMSKLLSVARFNAHVQDAYGVMQSSTLSSGLRAGMDGLFEGVANDLGDADRKVGEIAAMMNVMYREFSLRHGFRLGMPLPFSLRRQVAEIRALEALYQDRFGPLSLFMNEKQTLTRRFFESIAVRMQHTYLHAIADVERWMRALLAPIEGQIREHQSQLRKRLDSVRRVVEAGGELDARIAEIEAARREVERQVSLFDMLVSEVNSRVDRETSRAAPPPALLELA